jgi:hypothetical protein
MVRFQRQPPGTAITRGCLLVGGALSAVAGGLAIGRAPDWIAAIATGGSAGCLLVGGHRANHGAGGPVDRMLDDLLDRAWDAAVFGSIAWVARDVEPGVAAAALVALCASFLSSYVRARGAALAYSVEESHVTRGVRYGLVAGGLALGWLDWTLWAAAATAALAAIVRTGQVAGEERIA